MTHKRAAMAPTARSQPTTRQPTMARQQPSARQPTATRQPPVARQPTNTRQATASNPSTVARQPNNVGTTKSPHRRVSDPANDYPAKTKRRASHGNTQRKG